MDTIKFGNELKRLRLKRGLSQAKLYENIYDQSEVSRLESGSFFPRIQILPEIAERLEVSIIHLFEAATVDNYEAMLLMRTQINKLMGLYQYDMVLSIVNNELDALDGESEYKLFLEMNRLCASFYLGKIFYYDCIHRLKQLLHTGSFRVNSVLKMYIRNMIAVIHSEKGKFKQAAGEFSKIFDERNNISDTKFLVQAFFNYAKLLQMQNLPIESLNVANEGLSISKETEDLGFMGHYYFLIAENFIELERPLNEISENFKMASLYFKELGRTDLTDIIHEHYSEYLS